MLNVDHFLKKGATHHICEDYVYSKSTSNRTFVLLSDGCSSSPDTDVGARILVHQAKSLLEKDSFVTDTIGFEHGWFGMRVIELSKGIMNMLFFPTESLDATLGVIVVVGDDAYVALYGDGTICVKDKSEYIDSKTYSFSNNAPYYLSYWLDEGRRNIYLLDGGKLVEEEGCVRERFLYWSNPPIYRKAIHVIVYKFSLIEYPVVAIMSDGVGSFVKGGEVLQLTDVLSEFMSFKSMKGEFVKRRVKRAIRDFEKEGYKHSDDISVGAVYREEGV